MPLIYTLVIPAEPEQVEPSGVEWCRVGVVPGRGGADIGVPLNYSATIEIPLKYH